jgi:eukaryotic-like serine/threonine-protein kinase
MSTKKIQVQKYCAGCGTTFSAEQDLVNCPNDGELLIPVTKHPLVGTVVADKFEILELIGSGGWSIVYRARDITLGRLVAVKILRADLASTAEKIQRFEREARMISTVGHAHICQVFDYGILGSGQPFLVLEHVGGRCLSDILRQEGQLAVPRAVALMKQAAAALGAAHARGLVHRDFKPANIMVTPDQAVKVIDFGLAKTYETLAPEQLTQTGLTFGTPQYMSPEQVNGRVLDPRSDVYAFGCVLFEVLTGKTAVGGRNMYEIMQSHIEGEVVFDDPEGKIPAGLKTLTLTCLRKAPEERYQSMQELVEALHAFESQGKIKPPKNFSAKLLKRSRGARPLIVGAVALLLVIGIVRLAPNLIPLPGSGTGKSPFHTELDHLRETAKVHPEKALPEAQNLVSTLKAQGKEHGAEVIEIARILQPLPPNPGSAEIIKLAIETQKQSLPEDGDELLMARRVAASSMLAADSRQATPLLRDLVEAIRRKYGAESKELCQPMDSLAWALFNDGDYAGSEATYKQLLPLAEKHYSRHDTFYVRALGAMSWLYLNTDRYEEARQYSQKAVGLLSDEAPAGFRQDLLGSAGLAQQKCGNFDKAAAYYREALAISEKVDAEEADKIRGDLGHVLFEAKKYREAEPVLRDAAVRMRKSIGSQAPAYRLCLGDYVELLRRTGRKQQASAVEAAGEI